MHRPASSSLARQCANTCDTAVFDITISQGTRLGFKTQYFQDHDQDQDQDQSQGQIKHDTAIA